MDIVINGFGDTDDADLQSSVLYFVRDTGRRFQGAVPPDHKQNPDIDLPPEIRDKRPIIERIKRLDILRSHADDLEMREHDPEMNKEDLIREKEEVYREIEMLEEETGVMIEDAMRENEDPDMHVMHEMEVVEP